MKIVNKRNLDTYDKYSKKHIKENFDGVNNKLSNMPVFTKSESNIDTIKEDEEEIDLGLEPKKIDFPEVIGHVDVLVQTEYTPPVSEPLEISKPVVCGMFEPSKEGQMVDILNQLKDINNTENLFSVVRIMTQNGEKIGMCYTDEVGEYGTPIHTNIDFNSACELVKNSTNEFGVSQFDSANDKIVGIIPPFMIPKKSNLKSYKPF